MSNFTSKNRVNTLILFRKPSKRIKILVASFLSIGKLQCSIILHLLSGGYLEKA